MRHHIGLPVTKPREQIVALYKRLRSVGIHLNSKLVKRLTKEMLEEGASKIGMLVDGVMVFESEDETSVLMDYCLYNVERNGRNTIEQYLLDSPPDLDSDEMTCLRAMQYAKYSMFLVESIEPGYGVHVCDLLTENRHLLLDLALSSSAVPGLVLATRVQFLDDFSMTGGAAIPFAVLQLEDRREIAEFKRCARAMLIPDARGDVDPAPMLRIRLENGGGPRVRYEDPSVSLAGPKWNSRPTHSISSNRIPRNALCPCGSGKKYKQCCMQR